MCGRNSLFPPARDLERRFDAAVAIDGYRPRYNIAPGGPQAVLENADERVIEAYRWGLIPKWWEGRSPGQAGRDGFINARAETVPEKPSFREAWAERPCLVLSSDFYEWQERPHGPKQPYRIYRPDEPAFALAGVWEPPNGADTRTVTILTTEPNDLVARIHDRMPVVLRRDDEERWLRGDPDERADLCRPYPDADLEADPISRRVNNPEIDEPSLIDPVDDPQTGLGEFG